MTATPTPSFIITTVLPGPDRKRNPAPYHFRITYRNPDPHEPGCVATWQVVGGREEYQISLERTDTGELRWHCTCADAVYRDAGCHTHRCKHVQGLTQVFEPVGTPVCKSRAAA